MRCQEAFEAMSAKFDGELEASEAVRLGDHLGTCAACRAREEEIAGLARRLRGAAREQPEIPAALARRITQAVSPRPPRRAPFVFSLAFLGATTSFAAFTVVARARPIANELAALAAPSTCRQIGADGPIARACAEGGIAGAKLAMQELVKRARARGAKLECKSCHRDEQGFELREEARTRFAELLAPSST